MTSHPVQFRVASSSLHRDRIQVLIRLALLAAIAAVGGSSLYWLLYLALPAVVALLIVQSGGPRVLAEDGPRAVQALRWLAAIYAYLWLLTDELPSPAGSGPAVLEIELGGTPSVSSALERLLRSLPALVVAVVLTLAAGVLWLAVAILALLREQVPAGLVDFLALTLRYRFRLVAYHLSLVDRYPELGSLSPQPLEPHSTQA
jgi:Domain of unknown function (DUF4389)